MRDPISVEVQTQTPPARSTLLTRRQPCFHYDLWQDEHRQHCEPPSPSLSSSHPQGREAWRSRILRHGDGRRGFPLDTVWSSPALIHHFKNSVIVRNHLETIIDDCWSHPHLPTKERAGKTHCGTRLSPLTPPLVRHYTRLPPPPPQRRCQNLGCGQPCLGSEKQHHELQLELETNSKEQPWSLHASKQQLLLRGR